MHLLVALAALAAERPVVYGYHAYWTEDPATLDFARLSHVAIFSVGVDGTGGLTGISKWSDVAAAVTEKAHAAGTKVHLCVTAFDSSQHAAIFGNVAARDRLVDELAAQVDAYGADGVNVDFEGVSTAYTTDMLDFVDALKDRVDEVVLATPAVDWSGAWDYSELSARSDGLFIMGYGYHWTGGNPGPNDPLHGGGAWSKWALDWTVEDYLEHDADPDKVILGLPLYGQQWEATGEVPGTATGDAWSVTMEEAIPLGERYGAQYDAPTASPYAIGDGTQLWYPTHDSVMERIEFALDAGLAGVGFWALDYEGRDPAFWDRVEVVVADADPGEGADSGGDADGDGDADRDSGVDRGSGVARRIEGEDGGCGCGGRTGGSWIAILLVAARGSLRRR